MVRFFGEFNSKVNDSANNEFYTNPKSDHVKYIIWDLSKVEKVNFNSFDTVFPVIRDKISSHRLPNVKMGFVTSDEELKLLCKKYICESIEMGSTWKFKISDSCQAIMLWVNS
jgi:hypothetical protein